MNCTRPLDLDDESVVNEQIGTEEADFSPLEVDRYGRLQLNHQSGFRKHQGKGTLVDRLKKSPPKVIVDVKEPAYYDLSKLGINEVGSRIGQWRLPASGM